MGPTHTQTHFRLGTLFTYALSTTISYFSLQEMKFLPSMEIFCKVWVTVRRLQFSSKFDLVRLSCKPADELLHHRRLTIINQIIIIIISNTNSLLLNLFKYWNQVTIPQPVLKCKPNLLHCKFWQFFKPYVISRKMSMVVNGRKSLKMYTVFERKIPF